MRKDALIHTTKGNIMIGRKFRPKYPVIKGEDEKETNKDLKILASAIAQLLFFIMGATLCWGLLFALAMYFSK